MSFNRRTFYGSIMYGLLLAPSVLLSGTTGLPGASAPSSAARNADSGIYLTACSGAFAPEVVSLQPTQSAPGGRGSMSLLMRSSPYGVSVDADGHFAYEVTVEVTRLRRRGGAVYVVWAATPELDQVAKLGVLGDSARVTGAISWNKFLVFVSEETTRDGDTWAGPILLTGLSPSGRMHTMAGHGPFEDVDCQYF